jgi:hypothetical protein
MRNYTIKLLPVLLLQYITHNTIKQILDLCFITAREDFRKASVRLFTDLTSEAILTIILYLRNRNISTIWTWKRKEELIDMRISMSWKEEIVRLLDY